MKKFLKLFATFVLLFTLGGCGKLTVLSQNWKDRPTSKIVQISMVWLSNANGDWSGTATDRYSSTSSSTGAGIPSSANELDFGKIGEYFKAEGAVLLKAQGLSGKVEATDSRKGVDQIIQTSSPQKYWLIFEPTAIKSTTHSSLGTFVSIGVTSKLIDMSSGKEVWLGTYNLQAKKHLIDGRKFDGPMIKDMLASALKSISI